MLRALSIFFLKITGWKLGGLVPVPQEFREKCVVIGAPHTSNWDIVFTLAFMKVLGIKMRFTIKKEWLVFPINILLKPLGAIAVDRSPKVPGEERRSMTEVLIELLDHNDIALIVTPEGTRSKVTEWKTGFYHVAAGAKVPMLLAFLDYPSKTGGVLAVVYPTGDMDKDMREIMTHYKTIRGRFPEKFSLDTRYS